MYRKVGFFEVAGGEGTLTPSIAGVTAVGRNNIIS